MSEAVPAVWYLLKSNAALIAVVPAARIFSGVIPSGTAAPAIGLQHISTTRRRSVTGGEDRLCFSRVQIDVFSETYPVLRQVMPLVRAALPRSRGTVNGVAIESIVFDTEGPDIVQADPALYLRSQDVLVTWNE